jgi:hypothetical protein
MATVSFVDDLSAKAKPAVKTAVKEDVKEAI